jgi:hypothetical protein
MNKQITLLRFIVVSLAFLILGCAGPSRFSSYQIRKGEEDNLRKVKSIFLRQFNCQDTIISKAVRNLIIQDFLATNIKISNDSTADSKIDITITLSSDFAGGGSAVATHSIGSASFSNSGGGYISGITAQIIQADNVLASVSVSQSRTTSGIPDPPEVIAERIAAKIVCIYTEKDCPDY